jgi:hypothetical protein
MDDFNTTSLHESKNEWGVRIITILCPLIIEGFRSIFEESCKLCKDNEEMDKYLMTFQNFIARIPKWNVSIVEQERKRIVEKSKCTYLEELITCVHIIQLKILTAMRVGQKQKKIDISIPKLDDFIHKMYINTARKLYKTVYLFEIGIPALQMQKNQREMEIIVQECILNTVRDSIPVESILRAYMDESVEEEIIPIASGVKEKEEKDKKEKEEKEKKEKEDRDNKEKEREEKERVLEKPEISMSSVGDNVPMLKFNDNDSAMSSDNKEEIISAPKTIERLEEISDARYNQRKLEATMEEDEDRIKISDQSISLTDCVDLNASPNSNSSSIPDLVLDIEELPF